MEEQEEYVVSERVSPWLMDSDSETKVFTLAGFPAHEQSLKEELMKKIRELGGEVIETEEWDPKVTHVVTFVDNQKEGLSEKVMGAIAAGRWVLTKRYVEKSWRAGGWAATPKVYAWPREAVVAGRRRRHEGEGGHFRGVRAAVLMADERKKMVYRRILAAGGAECAECRTLRQLHFSDLLAEPGTITHVFLDTKQAKDPYLLKIIEKYSSWKEILFLNFKWIFQKLKGDPKEEDFDLLRKKKLKVRNRGKRSLDSNSEENNRKKSKSNNNAIDDCITLDSDEEDNDDCVILKDDTQQPVREVEIVDSDDDDIEILDRRLQESRREVGSHRTYVDTKKAKAGPKRKSPLTIDLDEDEDDAMDVVMCSPSRERSPSPDIMEVDQDERDQEKDDDQDITDPEESSDVAPTLENVDEDIVELSAENAVFEEQVVPSLDDYVPSVERIYEERVEPTLDLEPYVPDRNEVRVQPSPSEEANEAETAAATPPAEVRSEEVVREAIEKMAEDEPEETGTVVEIIPNEPSRVAPVRESEGGRKLASSLFSEQLKQLKEASAVQIAKTKISESPKVSESVSPILNNNLKSNSINVSQERSPKKSQVENESNLEATKPNREIEKRILETPKLVSRTPEAIAVAADAEKAVAISQGKSEKTDKLLNRIIATIQKRFTITDEGISIGNINARTIKYDKHGEGKRPRHVKVRPVEQRLEVDFMESLRETDMSSSAILTEMRRLEMETSSTVQPSSFLLHLVITKLLLGSEDRHIRAKAAHYLDTLVFLHLNNPSREAWLNLFLGACRNCEERNFKNFDFKNVHDLQACWKFFSEFIDKFLTAAETGNLDEESGCFLWLQSLTKILHRDFESWWKHWRPKQTEGAASGQLPLLHHLLAGGATTSRLLTNARSSVLRLYSCTVATTSSLPSGAASTIRKLVSMVGMLVSHQDSVQGDASLGRGAKLELASCVAQLVAGAQLEPRQLGVQLALLRPSWLSAAVAKQMLTTVHQLDTNQSAWSLVCRARAVVPASPQLSVTLDSYLHRVCGLQLAHAVFRANWHFTRHRAADRDFRTFAGMRRLEERGASLRDKAVRLEEVVVRQSSLVDTVNLIKDFANNTKQHPDQEGTGAVLALLFKMTSVDKF